MNRSHQRGVAAVEMALLVGFLLLLAGGIAEFGRAMYTYDTLAKQARAGARYLAIRQDTAASRAEARNVTLCGLPACGTPVVPGLALANIGDTTLTNVPTGAATGSLDMVSITISNYGFQLLFPIPGIPSITFGPIKVTMPRTT